MMAAPETTTHTTGAGGGASIIITQALLNGLPVWSYDHTIKVLAASGLWTVEGRMPGVTVGSEWVVLETAILDTNSVTLPQTEHGAWDAFRVTVTAGTADDNVFVRTWQVRRILF